MSLYVYTCMSVVIYAYMYIRRSADMWQPLQKNASFFINFHYLYTIFYYFYQLYVYIRVLSSYLEFYK